MLAIEFARTTVRGSITNLSTSNPRAVAAVLRSRILKLTPEEIEVDGHTALSHVWGVVIETAHPDAVASLVALIDGSVSLYVSDGNGCVGCGMHREVRLAGADLLQVADRSFCLATPTKDIDYPPQNSVRFYFLSFYGLCAAEVRLEDLSVVDTQLTALYFAAQRVANAIERVGAGQSLAQEIRRLLPEI